MIDRLKRSQTRIIVLSIIFLALTYIPLFMSPTVLEAFVNEDRIFETLTPIYFLITSILLILVFYKLPRAAGGPKYLTLKKISLIGFSLLFFVAAGEEISWGQRIFNIETPESVRQVNVQQELTIHNLEFFQGESSTLDFSQLQTLFSLMFAFLLPLAGLAFQRKFKFDLNALLPVMPLPFGILVVANYTIQKILRNIVEYVPQLYLHPTMPFVEGLYEVREHGNAYAMMLSVLFYLLLMLYPSSKK